jgi:electron transfer flavoprotein beta subunit
MVHEQSGRPLIAVCLRHSDHRPTVDPVTAEIDRDARGAGPGAAEWAALELALRIAEVWDARVLAVCAGPPDADRTLRDAAAVGAEVLRVVLPGVQSGGGAHGELEPLEVYLDELAADGRAVAAALVTAVRQIGEPDLVLCGSHSVDRGTGSVPAFLAAELGAAQALGLVRLEPDAGSDGGGPGGGPGGGLVGERRLDLGRRERLRIPRPAVVSVEAAGLRLRRAGMRAALAATRLEVPVVRPEAPPSPLYRCTAQPFRPRTRVVPAPSGDSSRERLLALTGALVERTPPTLLRPSSASEAADALIAYLRRNGYLDEDG